MKLNWGQYWYDLLGSVLRHIGTALAGWGGLNIAHATGASVPSLDLKALGVFVLSAGVIPAVSSFWAKTPLPDVDQTTITTTTTITKPHEEEEPNLK